MRFLLRGMPVGSFFDYYENVVWFMELCEEDGNSSTAFKLNELGQYERIAWCEIDEEDGNNDII